MASISAVIITYNEEKNIRRCLESLLLVADEIIVVDSFSTDATENICRELNVRFEQRKFDTYIAQKNFANQLAKHNYILSIDGDEALSEELQENLKKWKPDPNPADGYFIARRNNYCGKWIRYSGWYPDRKIRMWNRNKGEWGGPTPHEVVKMKPGSTTAVLQGDILHWSYTSRKEHEERIALYARLASEEMKRNGKQVRFLEPVYKPLARFIKHYFIKLGFLDGAEGFTIAKMAAKEARLKYTR